jgi:hypothetical protein
LPVKGLVKINESRPVSKAALARREFNISVALPSKR